MTTMFLWPLWRGDLARTTEGSTYALRVTMAGVTETLTFPASGSLTAQRNYWMAGDAQADSDGSVGGIGDLCQLLRATLLTHSQAVTVTVTPSAANIVSINTGLVLTAVLWANAATTLSATAFGFAQTDTSAAGVLTGAYQTRGAFCPRRWPSSDTRDVAAYTLGGAVAMSGRQRVARHAQARARRDITYDLLMQRYGLAEYVDATEPTGSLEYMWSEALSLGRPVRYYEDEASRTSTSYRLYVARAEDMTGARTDVADRDPTYRVRWMSKLALRRVTL